MSNKRIPDIMSQTILSLVPENEHGRIMRKLKSLDRAMKKAMKKRSR